MIEAALVFLSPVKFFVGVVSDSGRVSRPAACRPSGLGGKDRADGLADWLSVVNMVLNVHRNRTAY